MEKLGLWSLILSVTSLATIGNLGFTGSLIKFSAEFSTNNEFKKINSILNCSVLGVSILSFVLLTVVYFLGYYFLGYFVEEKWVVIGQNLLFYALISLYINVLAGLYFSTLEGLNLAYLKSVAFIFATLIYVILSVIFISIYDIIGLGYAQVCQAVVFLILGVLFCMFKIKNFKLLLLNWDSSLMKKVFNYGLNFQMIGIAQMLYDPITKAILAKYGGLNYVAIFEMASKLVVQVRAIVANIIQTLTPKIVKLNALFGKEKIVDAYKQINNINLILVFVSIAVIIPFGNILSIILLGSSDNNFILALVIISIGWMINSLNIPSYIVNLATSNLRWNVVAHISIGVLNLILCILIGYLSQNGIYIISSWVIALILGSLLIIYEFHKRQNISLHVIFNKVFYKLLISFMLLVCFSCLINSLIQNLFMLTLSQLVLVCVYYVIVSSINEVKQLIFLILKTNRFKN